MTKRQLTVEGQIWTGKLRDIDRRLAELEVALTRAGPGSYRHQELATEARDLAALRRVAANKLNEHSTLFPPAERAAQRERDRRLLAAEIRTRTRYANEVITYLEHEGDHRNARLHRMAMLDLPAEVCREFNLDPALITENLGN